MGGLAGLSPAPMQYRIIYQRCMSVGTVNSPNVIAGAKGLLLRLDSTRLSECGGPVILSRHWAKSLMCRMGFLKRQGTTKKTKMTVDNFNQEKTNFLVEMEVTVKMEDILPEMVFNWAQTRIHPVPRSSWTMEKKGAKCVECVGMTDKRQITVVFCGTLTG